MTEEIKTLISQLRHTGMVAAYMRRLAFALLQAAQEHDLSKLTLDEFPGFVEINQTAREHEFGSPGYNASLKACGDVIGLHYARNRHHPEHHARGVDDMNLVDFVEMVADWQAASEVYGKTTFEDGLKVLRTRFGLTGQHLFLVWMIHDALVGRTDRP